MLGIGPHSSLFCNVFYFKNVGKMAHTYYKTRNNEKYGPIPNVMAALPNIGGALCSTPQSLADARYWSAVQ